MPLRVATGIRSRVNKLYAAFPRHAALTAPARSTGDRLLPDYGATAAGLDPACAQTGQIGAAIGRYRGKRRYSNGFTRVVELDQRGDGAGRWSLSRAAAARQFLRTSGWLRPGSRRQGSAISVQVDDQVV